MGLLQSTLDPRDATEHGPLGSQLCTSCGLCCAGALHDTAVLDEDEIEEAGVLGLPVKSGDKAAFGLPCPMLQGTSCGIYGQRPRVCSRYRCKLLQRLETGTVSLPAALLHVGTAKDLINQLKALMPPGMLLSEARAFILKSADEQQHKDGSARLRVAATAAMLYIDRFFRGDAEGRLLQLRLVEANDEATQ